MQCQRIDQSPRPETHQPHHIPVVLEKFARGILRIPLDHASNEKSEDPAKLIQYVNQVFAQK
jgi:hypothetical protein